mgnify:CR=1 FL=1
MKIAILLGSVEINLSLLVDTVFLYLIWVIQLVIYPSFKYITDHNFLKWHKKYCNIIGFFVIPLMLFQLIESVILIIDFRGILNFAFVISTWDLTFTVFFNIHKKLSKEGNKRDIIEKLLKLNWLRVFLWSLLPFLNNDYSP